MVFNKAADPDKSQTLSQSDGPDELHVAVDLPDSPGSNDGTLPLLNSTVINPETTMNLPSTSSLINPFSLFSGSTTNPANIGVLPSSSQASTSQASSAQLSDQLLMPHVTLDDATHSETPDYSFIPRQRQQAYQETACQIKDTTSDIEEDISATQVSVADLDESTDNNDQSQSAAPSSILASTYLLSLNNLTETPTRDQDNPRLSSPQYGGPTPPPNDTTSHAAAGSSDIQTRGSQSKVTSPKTVERQLSGENQLSNTVDGLQYDDRCCSSCPGGGDSRQNPNLALVVVFLAVMIDVMLMTVVDPLLPDIMQDISSHPNRFIGNKIISKAPNLTSNSSQLERTSKAHSIEIGLMVGLKPGLEMFTNIGVGVLVDKFGHQKPMLAGCFFNFSATFGFAYLKNYYLLLIARALQALGSSLSVVGGLAFLAVTFPDSKERSVATAKAFVGVSVGVAGGFALGSILYEMVGVEVPFLVLAGLNLIDGGLRLYLVAPYKRRETSHEFKYVRMILSDKQILAGLAITFMQHVILGVFLGIAPAWMLFTLHGHQWTIGVILMMAAVVHVIAQCLTSRLAYNYGPAKFLILGLLILALGMAAYPWCNNIWQTIGPECITRIGHGILMACVNPALNHMADLRHDSRYGIVNGLYTASYDIGLFAGPSIGGALIRVTSFMGIFEGCAVILILSCSLAYTWRNFHYKTVINTTVHSSGRKDYGSFRETLEDDRHFEDSYPPI